MSDGNPGLLSETKAPVPCPNRRWKQRIAAPADSCHRSWGHDSADARSGNRRSSGAPGHSRTGRPHPSGRTGANRHPGFDPNQASSLPDTFVRDYLLDPDETAAPNTMTNCNRVWADLEQGLDSYAPLPTQRGRDGCPAETKDRSLLGID